MDHVPAHQGGGEPLAPDRHMDISLGIGVQIGQADGALAGGVQDLALAVKAVVGDHGAGGDIADRPVALVHRHPGPDHPPVPEGDGEDLFGRAVGLLGQQGGFAYKVPLLRGEAHGEPGQRHGEHRHPSPVLVQPHLMAVQRKPRLQPEGVPGAQARGSGPLSDQLVPKPPNLVAVDEQLEPDRVPGVAGAGEADGTALDRQDPQIVLFHLRQPHGPGQSLQNGGALRPLDGDGGILVGDVGEGAVILCQIPGKMLKVLVRIGGVDHQQIPTVIEHIQVGVVHREAMLVGDDAVLSAAGDQGGGVAGEHPL